MGWLVSSGVRQLPFCQSGSQATIILPTGKAAENPEMFEIGRSNRHDLPVLTILVLLCKEANSPGLTGTYERQVPDGWLTNRYHYRVVRLWQENPEDYLTAEVGLVPLAPLTNVTEVDLSEIVRRMAGRINVEPRPRAAKLWTATYLLMGVRYPDDVVNQLLEGIQTMRESSTYQAILREGRQEGRQEGRVEGEQKLLLRMGTKRFGKPDAATVAAIEAVREIDRLENLGERILDPGIRDWDELLRTP
jgi:hypothetical protein